jgi:uncharacterized cupredoxin-like copper-binding protein/Cu/Ag efflux protein CusF
MKISFTPVFFALSLCFGLAAQVNAAEEHAAHDHGAGALGQVGQPGQVSRSVKIVMSDAMRFSPNQLMVKQGETIRFVVSNPGRLKHELTLGSTAELLAHAELMKKNPEMEHADGNMLTVQPGQTGEIIWQFTQAGTVYFACLQPGHYEAGMKGSLKVMPQAGMSHDGHAGHHHEHDHASMHAAMAASMPMMSASMPMMSASMPMMSASMPAMAMPMSQGEVKKIDAAARKITLKHGAIANLDMPGMTMVFQLKDPALLNGLKVGDRVSFSAEKSGGAIVITAIQAQP